MMNYTPKRIKGLPLEERLERWSIPVPECGCRIWLGSLNEDGYGHIEHGGTSYSVHRAAWMTANGCSIPAGMCVLHSCDIPSCINPNHLSIGSHADNMADRTVRGRTKFPQYTGHLHPMAKLTDDQVAAIRASTEAQHILAARFGVAQSHISNIKRGRKWRIA